MFICENNMYSCNTHLRNRQTSNEMIRFAKSHNIRYERIEFNEELDSIIDKIKSAFIHSLSGPFFLEINSYRLYEHCGHKKDIEIGDRNEKEFNFFEQLDKVNKWISNEESVLNSYNEAYKDCSARCKDLSEESISLKKI